MDLTPWLQCRCIDIMTDASASDNAMQFADYVLGNYIAVESKFPPILWAKPLTCYTLIHTIALSLITAMNAEFYVHLRVRWCTEKRFSKQRCHGRHGSLNTSERRQSLWCQPPTIIAHSLLQEMSFWISVSSLRTENRTVTMLVVLILFHLDFSHAFF